MVKKPVEIKSTKVEFEVTNSHTGTDDSTVIQIRISGSSSAARDRVAKAIGQAVRAACENLTQPPKALH